MKSALHPSLAFVRRMGFSYHEFIVNEQRQPGLKELDMGDGSTAKRTIGDFDMSILQVSPEGMNRSYAAHSATPVILANMGGKSPVTEAKQIQAQQVPNLSTSGIMLG